MESGQGIKDDMVPFFLKKSEPIIFPLPDNLIAFTLANPIAIYDGRKTRTKKGPKDIIRPGQSAHDCSGLSIDRRAPGYPYVSGYSRAPGYPRAPCHSYTPHYP